MGWKKISMLIKALIEIRTVREILEDTRLEDP